MAEITIDGQTVTTAPGETLIQAAFGLGIETPTMCHVASMTPVNVCRMCVVEVEGSRTLVPACSREAEDGMVVETDSERVRHSRKLVLELLGSSVDLSQAPNVSEWMEEYAADPSRFGEEAATVAQPVKVEDDLYIRDYSKCILCNACVSACGIEAQGTFAIGVAGRGFDSVIATEFDVALPDSACVYCGNCIAVCPTGALQGKIEFDMRAELRWRQNEQTVTETICPYCGVGCPLELHVQDNEVVKVTSPMDNDITNGMLCVKGRFFTVG
jgi:predicted molibdopterin-dependent oxidoreductase YjgC